MSIKKTLIAVGVMSMLSSYATLASAETGETLVTENANAYSVSVKYSKAELASHAGTAQIFSRIQEAAYRSCKAEYSYARFVKKRREMKNCVTNVTQDLVTRIENNNLTKIAAQQPATRYQIARK
ncbi:MAG: hypothetical protein COA43_02590 [Robiginitomaculum sp.]|nr:MAG: hypothetical protein COA43_02590 [Robiginitomaculum sp.]